LKIKKEKDADLAVLGAYYGKGKRSKWLGAFLLGVYDQNKNKLLPIAKIGTGFSDAQLQVFTERYLPLTLTKPPLNVEKMKPEPHIWLPV
jgi:DNA ligase-1